MFIALLRHFSSNCVLIVGDIELGSGCMELVYWSRSCYILGAPVRFNVHWTFDKRDLNPRG